MDHLACFLVRLLVAATRPWSDYERVAASVCFSPVIALCLFDPDPDPDPDQVVLGGLHPGVSSVHLLRRQWPTAFLLGKVWRSCAIRWHHLPGRPQAGSYADRFPRLVKIRLRARRLGSSAHSASLR